MTKSIAILMPGDMGHGVGQALVSNGYDVITTLDGRSDHTRMLAAKGGLRDVGPLDDVVAQAHLILSILPPNHAVPQAEAVAAAMTRTGQTPVYVDCNAISPMTATKVAEVIAPTGATMIDCGIIGLNPIKSPPTRFYVSGPDCSLMETLDCDTIAVTRIADTIGQASALKMVYAAMTKGTWALQIALLMAASQHGVLDPLLKEFDYSQPGPLKGMRSKIPVIPADSERWTPEMQEIAATFAQVGVTSAFHDGAAEIFGLLARTPFASETRETLDDDRTLEQALGEFVKHLPPA